MILFVKCNTHFEKCITFVLISLKVVLGWAE